jgi:hypothetical protein
MNLICSMGVCIKGPLVKCKKEEAKFFWGRERGEVERSLVSHIIISFGIHSFLASLLGCTTPLVLLTKSQEIEQDAFAEHTTLSSSQKCTITASAPDSPSSKPPRTAPSPARPDQLSSPCPTAPANPPACPELGAQVPQGRPRRDANRRHQP